MASLLLVAFVPSASANVIYEYVGEPFTIGVQAPLTAGDRVTGFMEFADTLAGNLDLVNVTGLRPGLRVLGRAHYVEHGGP